MNIIEEVTKRGHYTAYGVPFVQIEGSFVWMYDNIQTMIDIGYYGAIEIFETPNMTMEKLEKDCRLKNAEQGELLKWLRGKYKTVYKYGDFWTD